MKRIRFGVLTSLAMVLHDRFTVKQKEASMRSIRFGVLTSLVMVLLCGTLPAWGYTEDAERWTSTITDGSGLVRGDVTTVLWSIVPEGEESWSNTNSTLISFYDDNFNVPTNDRTHVLTNRVWWQTMNDHLSKITRTTGLTMQYVAETDENGDPTGNQGDIRVGGKPMTGSQEGAATGCNHPGLNMRTGEGYSVTLTKMKEVLTHEVGHKLAIWHEAAGRDTGVNLSVMDGGYSPSPTSGGYQLDDIAGIHGNYGDPLEKNGGNDTFATAYSLGTFDVDESTALGTDMPNVPADIPLFADDFLGIHSNDVDYFKFTINSHGTDVAIRLTPKGPTYGSAYPNKPDGMLDVSSRSDLSLALYDQNEALIVSSNSGGLGEIESIKHTLAAGD